MSKEKKMYDVVGEYAASSHCVRRDKTLSPLARLVYVDLRQPRAI
jgi:hypothetical protein